MPFPSVHGFPVTFLAVDLAVVFLLVVAACVTEVRRNASNVVVRGTMLAAIVVSFIVSPWLTDWLIQRLNPTVGFSRVFIDESWIATIAPAGIAVIIILVACTAFSGAESRTTRWRIVYGFWSVAFLAANSVNHASWTVWFGFPFPYYSRSDAILVFNGESPSPWSPASGILDIAVYLAVTIALAIAYRRCPRID